MLLSMRGCGCIVVSLEVDEVFCGAVFRLSSGRCWLVSVGWLSAVARFGVGQDGGAMVALVLWVRD